MWKLILLDLDGTLLRSDKTVSDYTLDVLERCRAKGCKLAICTARGAADDSTETNDADGVAKYLERRLL